MSTQNATAEKISLYQPDQKSLIFLKFQFLIALPMNANIGKSIWLQPVGHSITTALIMDLPGT